MAVAADLVDDLAVDVGDGEVDLEGEVEGLVDEVDFGGLAEVGAAGRMEGGLGVVGGQAGEVAGRVARGGAMQGEDVGVQRETPLLLGVERRRVFQCNRCAGAATVAVEAVSGDGTMWSAETEGARGSREGQAPEGANPLMDVIRRRVRVRFGQGGFFLQYTRG